jgi:hypothetical protein
MSLPRRPEAILVAFAKVLYLDDDTIRAPHRRPRVKKFPRRLRTSVFVANGQRCTDRGELLVPAVKFGAFFAQRRIFGREAETAKPSATSLAHFHTACQDHHMSGGAPYSGANEEELFHLGE